MQSNDDDARTPGMDDTPPEEPTREQQLLQLALGLPDSKPAIDALDGADFAMLCALTANATRASMRADDLVVLADMRRVALLRNDRPALALLLMAQGEVARALGAHAVGVDAYETLVGVRDLMGDKIKAHDAALWQAEALEEAGRPGEAEAVLMAALKRARALAPPHVEEAGRRMGVTLRALGELLVRQGRHDEAEAWLAGADDF